jgi:hypothetical protein
MGTVYFFDKLIEDPSVCCIAYHPQDFDRRVTTSSNLEGEQRMRNHYGGALSEASRLASLISSQKDVVGK